MESKYYTPSIEEFHIGFEYEYQAVQLDDNYYKSGLHGEDAIKKINRYIEGRERFLPEVDYKLIWQPKTRFSTVQSLRGSIESARVRVKYLDKEDIESLGFKHTGHSVDEWFSKEGSFKIGNWTSYSIQIHYGLEDHRMYINAIDSGGESTIFEGTIKNKSELKVLLKQLNIK